MIDKEDYDSFDGYVDALEDRIAEYQQECKRLCFEVGFEKRRADNLRDDLNNQANSIEEYQRQEVEYEKRIAELEAELEPMHGSHSDDGFEAYLPPKGDNHD